MSVESFAIALMHSRATGTAKLVLLGIANHDGDGGAWPSVATLARYGNCDRRNAIRALDKLEALGEIRRIRGAGGDHATADNRRPNLYRFLLRCPADCDRTPRHRTPRNINHTPLDLDPSELSTGVADAPPGGGSATSRGGGSATQTNHLTNNSSDETNSSTRAGENEERSAPSSTGRCAMRPTLGHSYVGGYCQFCSEPETTPRSAA